MEAFAVISTLVGILVLGVLSLAILGWVVNQLRDWDFPGGIIVFLLLLVVCVGAGLGGAILITSLQMKLGFEPQNETQSFGLRIITFAALLLPPALIYQAAVAVRDRIREG